MKNTLTVRTRELEVDLAVQDDVTVLSALQVILKDNEVVTKVIQQVELTKESDVKAIASSLKDKLQTTIPTPVLKDIPKPVSKPMFDKPIQDKKDEPTKATPNPPLWLVECGNDECCKTVIINRNKHIGNDLVCKDCGHSTDLDPSLPVFTKFTCECGAVHHIMIHSTALVVNTKCRQCEMPIDLKWNENKERYEKM